MEINFNAAFTSHGRRMGVCLLRTCFVVVLGLLANGCLVRLDARTTSTSNPIWRTPVAVDYGAVVESDVNFLNARSFDSFEAKGNSSEAFLNVTNVYLGTPTKRQYFHRYTPRSQSGAGWSDGDLIAWDVDFDDVSATPGQSALAISPGGDVFAFLGRGLDAGCGNTRTQYFELPFGVALNPVLVNSDCLETLDSDDIDTYLREVHSVGVADDGAGGFFIARRDDSDADNDYDLMIRRYVAGALAAADIQVSANVSDFQAISDGVKGSVVFMSGSQSGGAPGFGATASLSISAGYDHACALNDNRVFCWGNNTNGQLGIANTTASSNTPIEVDFTGTDVENQPIYAVEVGFRYSCVVYHANYRIFCWGKNDNLQLGCPPAAGEVLPGVSQPVGCLTTEIEQFAVNTVGDYTRADFSAGYQTACAIVTTGGRNVYCWGDTGAGEAGQGTTGGNTGPGLVVNTVPAILTNVWNISVDKFATPSHACVSVGAEANRNLYCWGDNSNNRTALLAQVDRANQLTIYVPALVSSMAIPQVGLSHSIATSARRTCLIANGRPVCFGDNTTDPGPPSQRNAIGSVDREPRHIGDDMTGNDTACGSNACIGWFSSLTSSTQIWMGGTGIFVESDGDIYAWGYRGDEGDDSIFGDGGAIGTNATVTTSPELVWTSATKPEVLTLGYDFGCGIFEDGSGVAEYRCWGEGTAGQLGNRASQDSSSPVTVSLAQLGCQSSECLSVADSTDGFATAQIITTGLSETKRFHTASDNAGNLAVAYIRDRIIDPDNYECVDETASSAAGLESCNYRLFANVRTSDGTWTGDLQVDLAPSIDIEASSYSLPTTTSGDTKTEYFRPGVAALGSGKFMFVFALKEEDRTSGTRYSTLYSRIYDISAGWEEDVTLIDSQVILNSTVALRHHHAIEVSCDAGGEACAILVQFMETEDDNATNRRYGWRLYSYSASSQQFTGQWQLGSPYYCQGDQDSCWRRTQPFVHLFSKDEGLVILATPVSGGLTDTRLLSLEYY